MSATTTKKSPGRKALIATAVLIVLAGAGVMLYPKATDLRYDWAQWRLSAAVENAPSLASGDTAGVTGQDGSAASADTTGPDGSSGITAADAVAASKLAGGIQLPKGTVARIEIPALHFKAYVLEGTDGSVLAKGPGHYPGTPLPGEAGNACIAGHRTTHGHAFRDLDKLQPGDLIFTATAGHTAVYRVVKTLVVSPTDVSVASQSGTDRLTLTTCHPKGSAKQRLVVVAELIIGL